MLHQICLLFSKKFEFFFLFFVDLLQDQNSTPGEKSGFLLDSDRAGVVEHHICGVRTLWTTRVAHQLFVYVVVQLFIPSFYTGLGVRVGVG